MMLTFDVEDKKFVCRTTGIIIHKNKVLFQKDNRYDFFWYLPGGRVEFLETAEQALKRELVEEYNLNIVDSKLAWIVENFFELDGKHFHELGFYYWINIDDNDELLNYQEEFKSIEEGYLHRWISIQEFDQYNIVPKFIKNELIETSEITAVKHIINHEREV